MREMENAVIENAAQDHRGGKCRKRKCGTRLQGWKMWERKMREKDLMLTEVNKFCLSQTCPRFDTIQATVYAYNVLNGVISLHRNTASRLYSMKTDTCV